ncbi:glycoside hydrolase family 43 protein [Catenovulum sp. 2E275]|uniref:glycoside hydrolase family 43 protein n=1 Tax=Catenovulum sp. 2E275 TaxID=2980497 RepID=UPI0021CF35F9|nr:glycoside hydrolase family 43 protein [Catenovulum sp. 2E275]MCU4674038.1 glycoside hydrolase family 43 protein [Catenovulum sp. 2E275]
MRYLKPLKVLSVCALLALAGCSSNNETESDPNLKFNQQADTAYFDWFKYQGNDTVFNQPLAADEFQNPIISGFYPDPSITRKGDDYYIATSSFAYNQGLPIFHSKDLVNWTLIGHGLTRDNQFDLSGIDVSSGIYAPTIRYHNGLFYIITTAVYSGGNFIITAQNPAGPWSKPILLPEVGGIDPDIFFDDDGKVYIAHNDAPLGKPLYEGHRAIWLWEYDPVAQKVKPESRKLIVDGGTDISKKPIWIEAPHIYKINGWYYLVCAEGGTGYNHSAVVFRTKDLNEPFTPYQANPILTQRDLDIDRPDPITTAGHADLIKTPQGQWWAVFLATRSYNKTLYNTGRETFLLPVTWTNDGWPEILPKGETIPYRLKKPTSGEKITHAEQTTGNFSWTDEFETKRLDLNWSWLGSHNNASWLRLNNGYAQLKANKQNLMSLEQPVYLARRVQHQTYQASTKVLLPKQTGLQLGITAYQNEKFHYFLGLEKIDTAYRLFVESVVEGKRQVLKHVYLPDQVAAIELVISGDKDQINFSYRQNKVTEPVLMGADATILSTEKVGGFVGSMLGLHARKF